MKQSYLLVAGAISVSAIVGTALAIVPLRVRENLSVTLTAATQPVLGQDKTQADVPFTASTKPHSISMVQVDNFSYQQLSLVDQAQSSRDFFQFRQRLRQAVRDRNAGFIRSIVTPHTKLSFGGSLTLDDLDIDNPKAPIWLGMEKAFSVGCAKASGSAGTPTWVCPHVFQVWPDNLDPFNYVAILGKNVNIRSQASINSPAVAVLSNEVVKLAPLQRKVQLDLNNLHDWSFVILPNGRRGYVLNRYVYSPVGYRGFFEKIGKDWKMNFFVAGD